MLATFLLALVPPTRWFAAKRVLLRSLGIAIGGGTRICGRVRFHGGGQVAIGRDCWIGIGAAFYTAPGAGITIGDRCDIGPEVSFNGGSHRIGDASRRAGHGIAEPIAVGSGSWIGHRATLMGGCSVGTGSVVGAGALLLARSYPDSAMLLGVPARVARILDEKGGRPAPSD